MTITMLTKNLENKNKKVLIIEMKKEHDLLFLFGKNNKLIHKK